MDQWNTRGMAPEYLKKKNKKVLIPFQFINKLILESSKFYNFDVNYFGLEKI